MAGISNSRKQELIAVVIRTLKEHEPQITMAQIRRIAWAVYLHAKSNLKEAKS